ncbi:UNVERIFIED_CONTAM: hypothetical protein Sindi_2873900 [Sesamum indicum]
MRDNGSGLITDLECMEIIYTLPIHGGDDRINWRFSEGRPTTQSLYRLFCPPGPKVGWSSLLSEDALQLYDNIFDLLGQILSGQETWNGHRGSGGESILSILLIEHYLVHAYTIYGERGT